jgi:hypothetical protein
MPQLAKDMPEVSGLMKHSFMRAGAAFYEKSRGQM